MHGAAGGGHGEGPLREDDAVVEGVLVEGLQGHACEGPRGEEGVLERGGAAEVWEEGGVQV